MRTESHLALIGLGSNLEGPAGKPQDYIRTALARLDEAEDVSLLRQSRIYRSAPWGREDQGQFVNAVAEVGCRLGAGELLDTLLAIEDDLGRTRSEKWGARLIDLDLLCFDDRQFESERLVVPHPFMHERAFVLVPLLELYPDFSIPGKGRADQCLAALGEEQLVELI